MRHAQENIILIGMPGVGKTTIATALAERLQRPLIDCDDVFEERYCHPGEYIKTYWGSPISSKKKRPSWPNFAKPPEPLLPPAAAL